MELATASLHVMLPLALLRIQQRKPVTQKLDNLDGLGEEKGMERMHGRSGKATNSDLSQNITRMTEKEKQQAIWLLGISIDSL